MLALLIAYELLAIAAIAQAGLFTLHLFENRRFVRARKRQGDKATAIGHAAIFAPCKGNDIGLAASLAMLLDQDYHDYQVNFIVESPADPAYWPIAMAIADHPHAKARVVIAGRALESGQKVHNLLAATERLDDRVEFLAFVDSDARVDRAWLRNLIARLDRPEIGAVTGYRWFVPMRPTFANLLLSAINAVVAGLLGPGGHMFVWGGSWALRRETFEKLRIRQAWHGTLSDDLVVTRAIQQAKLRIEFEPNCLVASPLDMRLVQVFEFLRRQYVIGRCYATSRWAGAVAVVTLANLALWASVVIAIACIAAGSRWTWIPVCNMAILGAAHWFRAWLRQEMARAALPTCTRQLRPARLFDLALAPFIGLFNWLGLASSLVGNKIAWRGNAYQIDQGGRIRLLSGPALSQTSLEPQVVKLPASGPSLGRADRAA